MDIRIDKSEKNLYFPLENVISETVAYKILNSDTKQLLNPYASFGGVLTGKSTKSKDTAIVVPNISDFLVLLNAKVPGNIVCLPNGVKNLPLHILPSLERFNKLILWFGNDEKSWDVARTFAKKLGEKRCLFIRYVFTSL